MPQLSIYITKDTLKKVEKAASEENISLSKWVQKTINEYLNHHWPDNYFDLFGAINDKTFDRPEQHLFDSDTDREPL